ncbi:hypothetical protein [Thermovibrio sp.]
MEKPTLKMTLRECLVKFPQLKDKLYELIEECIYCEGFKDEELKEVFEAHRLNPEKALKELLKELEK